MKLFRVLLPVFFFVFVFHAGCKKSDNSGFKAYTPEYVTATISGRATDDAGKPVSGALVKAGSSSTTTDIDGMFIIQDVTIDKQAAFIKVEKDGFFLGTKTVVAYANRNNQVAIRLIRKTLAGSITASAGGTVPVTSSGGSIVFEANSIVNPAGNTPYTGTVSVSAFFINPETADFNDIIPGALRGITSNNQETGLQSFGMMAVELAGSAGEKLQLAPGTNATLHFPIPASLQGEAPATIPLWSLNETTGLWKEEGAATRQGNEYIGTVSHFSFWNCDAPFPVIEFTGVIRDQQGNTMAGVEVQVVVPAGGSTAGSVTGTGLSNADGLFTGKIPANKTLQLKIYNKCRALIHSQNIGPFSTSSDLGLISLNNTASQVTLSGTVKNCSNEAVANGFVTIRLEGVYYNIPFTGGSFTTTITRCTNEDATASITAFDLTTQQSGEDVSIPVSGSTVNAGTLVACGSISDTYIRYTVDGVSYQVLPPDTVRYIQAGQSNTITGIEGMRVGKQYEDIVIIFTGPRQPGSHPVIVSDIFFGNSTIQFTRNGSINADITEYGEPGGYVTGTFSGNVSDSLVTKVVPINCSFRVKRP